MWYFPWIVSHLSIIFTCRKFLNSVWFCLIVVTLKGLLFCVFWVSCLCLIQLSFEPISTFIISFGNEFHEFNRSCKNSFLLSLLLKMPHCPPISSCIQNIFRSMLCPLRLLTIFSSPPYTFYSKPTVVSCVPSYKCYSKQSHLLPKTRVYMCVCIFITGQKAASPEFRAVWMLNDYSPQNR